VKEPHPNAITHTDKRANLPTADPRAQDFVTQELERPIPVHYKRDPTLDPQLVWKGKDELDREDLVAEAPAIYIQEKIDPRVIIENLRDTAERPEDEPELTLFETFDGLDELDLVDFYRHPANWSNRMILGDSLNVMASLTEREGLRGKVQMIYIDPPYGIKFGSNWQASARKRDVKDGRLEDASREVEQIKAFRDTWELGIQSYLSYLRDRLAVARELMTDSGSIFVQIGDENVHLVRCLMDEVFGAENFVSAIAFVKTSGLAAAQSVAASVDYLLWYGRDRERIKFRQLFFPRDMGDFGMYSFVELADGSRRKLSTDERRRLTALPEGSRLYRHDNLTKPGPGSKYTFQFEGKNYTPGSRWWGTTEQGMQRLAWGRRLSVSGSTLAFVRYWDDFAWRPISNLWTDTATGGFAEEKIYVVQTGTKIVQRCMLMTTDPGDLVLDPTCGSGTTAFVAEQWGRRWITIDTSRVALALARQRLMGARFPWYLLADSVEGRRKEEEFSGTALPPAEVTNDIRHGFVYELVMHITLKSMGAAPLK